MRLAVLHHGQERIPRAFIKMVGTLSPPGLDDVALTSMYRPSFFGRPWIALLRQVMRGPSDWSTGERELFAAFTAWLNRCPYCVGVHSGTASLGLGIRVDVDRLENWRERGFDYRVLAIFELLETITLAPAQLVPEHFQRARDANISDDAIRDALHVNYIMNVINRLANAFDFSFGDERGRKATARALHRLGYRLPRFLLR